MLYSVTLNFTVKVEVQMITKLSLQIFRNCTTPAIELLLLSYRNVMNTDERFLTRMMSSYLMTHYSNAQFA